MELYRQVSYELAERLTRRYSTSFSMSSRLFASRIRPHIYAVYGMVRLADEIVDTYRGDDAMAQLDNFEAVVYLACKAIQPIQSFMLLLSRPKSTVSSES